MVAGSARPGPARTRSEAEILAAGLRLLDSGGSAALSVRSVAAAVGVAPNAIYTYFPTKAALVKALLDDLLGGLVGDGPADGRPWREEVGGLVTALREVLLAHPGAVPLLLVSAFDGPNALAAGERLLAALERSGLSPADAARASYLLQTYVLGSVALDVAELDPTQLRPDDDARTAARRSALTAVPAEHYPRTAAAIDVVAAYSGAEQFRWGLERVLDAVAPRTS
jgi:TetR/AcrR family tetracycline transcriptional repressor